jgi:hypothetical protein
LSDIRCILGQWESGSVHSCKGTKTFTLYLRFAMSWQDTDAEVSRYQHL